MADVPTIDYAVRALTARYCDAVLRFDPERFGALWMTDAQWIAPAGTTIGRDKITRVFAKLRGQFPLCTQELMSGWVEPEADDAANATWQIREYQWRSDGSVSCVLGVYHDRVVLDGGTWRFAARQFHLVYRGPVALSGGTLTPPTF